MSSRLVIGIDFDNTLVVYDELFQKLAEQRGVLAPPVPRGKKEIRDAIRQLPEGEIHWQRLQAAAYGPRIGEARLAEGVMEFLDRCRQESARVYVVSHKTLRAGYDETDTDLRQAAMNWMEANGLFRDDGSGLRPERVYFGSTRQEKIEYLRCLGCTHFIDDLEETFCEPSFPASVDKILYAPHTPDHTLPGVRVARSWKQINGYCFGNGFRNT